MALLLLPAGARASGWTSLLEPSVTAAAAGFNGNLSLYVIDVETGAELAWGADSPAYLSSAIKVVVMLEVLRQRDAGELDLDEKVVFGEDDIRDGVGPIRTGPPGRRFTLRELLVLMMGHSDNAAADLLMGRVGLERMQQHLADRGIEFGQVETLLGERRRIYGELDPLGRLLSPSQVRELGLVPSLEGRARLFSRMVGRSPAFTEVDLEGAFESFYRTGINSASMREVGRLLAQVARCEGLSPRSCTLARNLMASCRTGAGRIRAGVPASAVWAHKTGTQYHRACDVGILYPAPERPIAIAACTRFEEVAEAERLFASVGRAVWSAFASGPVRGPR